MVLSRSSSLRLWCLLGSLASLTALPAAPTAPDTSSHLVVEQAVETEAGFVTLPASPGGPLNVRPCATCPPVAYRTDGETQYYARSAHVTAADWQSLSRESAKTPVTVLISSRTHLVTRVLIDLPMAARRTP